MTLFWIAFCFFIKLTFGNVPVGDYLFYDDLGGKPYTVTSDKRSFIINGKRTLLLGGTVHYPRMSYYDWKEMLMQMKSDGLNHVQTYVFWNLHEPTYNFNGTHIYNYNDRANITHYLEIAKEVGIFVNVRIGPFVAAEWRFGSLPPYLLHVDGIIFRGYNNQWQYYMKQFVEEISTKIRPYLAKEGGPVLLAQIENEYHGKGTNGTLYVEWCGQLAISLNFSIPWVMCNGESSNLTINTCNGNDCYKGYLPNHLKTYLNQPLAWTEDEGWFQAWQGDSYNANKTGRSNRSPQDMANVIAKWFGGGASHHNYYMYFGGNHLANYAGSGITNYYADGVNYHADRLPNEPKRSHLVNLHKILGEKQKILLYDNIQYGNEIHLNTTNSLNEYLYIQQCMNNPSTSQIWQYNVTTKLLYNNYNSNHCIYFNGKSNPVGTKTCNVNDKSQQFIYNSNQNKQFMNVEYHNCLDIDHKTQTIDEWQCKNTTSVNNQQWNINKNTINAVQNMSNCLTLKTENNKVGYNLFAYVYKGENGEILSFLYNNDSSKDYNVIWDDMEYYLPSSSVSIVDYEGVELFNSAKVNTNGLPTKRIYNTIISGKTMNFSSWTEPIPVNIETQKIRKDTATLNISPFEQIRFTNDTNQHLVYSTNITGLSSNNDLSLKFEGGEGNTYDIFFDNNYIAQTWNGAHAISLVNYTINIASKYILSNITIHKLNIVSTTLGIATHVDQEVDESYMDHKGIVGMIQLHDNTLNKIIDLRKNNWLHWIGLTGELLNIQTESGMNNVNWIYPANTHLPLTWYQTYFEIDSNTLNNDGVILLDIGLNDNNKNNGFNRGYFYLNGINMGYYNNVIQNDVMMQRYYFLPKGFIYVNKSNRLVFIDELPNVTTSNINIVHSTFVIPN